MLSEPENTYRETVKVFSGERPLIANKDILIFAGYKWFKHIRIPMSKPFMKNRFLLLPSVKFTISEDIALLYLNNTK